MNSDIYKAPARVGLDAANEVLGLAIRVEDGAKLVIDASEVESIDGPAAVAFANIAQSLTARGAGVQVKAPSSAFVDAFADLGLFEDLMKMEFLT